MRPPGSWPLVALVLAGGKDTPAGYILTRNAADEAEIFSIVVAPVFRNHGVGLALLTAMEGVTSIRGANAVFLEVGIDNLAARAHYSKVGFELIGQRPDYYQNSGGDRVTALVLHNRLENVENRESD